MMVEEKKTYLTFLSFSSSLTLLFNHCSEEGVTSWKEWAVGRSNGSADHNPKCVGPSASPWELGASFPPDVQAETTEKDSVLLMHTLLVATKDPLAMDPPVVNWPKKSKTKKVPIKAITNTITTASPVPSANVITINKSKIPSQALKLPITPQINQASATTEEANTQASSVTTQPTKSNRQRETLLRQSKAPNLQLAVRMSLYRSNHPCKP